MNNIVRHKKWNKVFTVTTEGPCDCACPGCGTPRLYKPRTTKDILADIESGAKNGYEVIEIIGGEPTMHKDFFIIYEFARKLYKKLCITSNGINLADRKFAKKVSSLVDNINISLYGHNAKIHESWNNKKGSFQKTIAGIKNCSDFKNSSLSLTHLVWKNNYQHLRDIVKLDLYLGITMIGFLNIQPIGDAENIYSSLTPRLKDLKNFGSDFVDLLDDFKSVELEDYPLCIFPENILRKTNKNIHIVDIAGQVFTDSSSQVNCYDLFMVHNTGQGIDSTLKIKDNIDLISEKNKNYRNHLSSCEKCKYLKICNGVFDSYVRSFGREETEKEIEDIRKHNKV